MTLWIAGILLAVLYGIFKTYYDGPWHSKSKYFQLHKVLIDLNKVSPDFVAAVSRSLPPKSRPGFLTYLPNRVTSRHGTQGYQIVGWLKQFNREWSSKNFIANIAFKQKVHEIAAREVPAQIMERAKALETGEVRLVDDRWTSSADHVPDIHVIGIYHVENGMIVGYSPNSAFQVFSDQGPIELVEPVRRVLYAEIPKG